LKTWILIQINAAGILVFSFLYESITHNRRFLFDSQVHFF